MTISEIISNIDDQNEEAIIFAKRENEKFLPSSQVALINLAEEEETLSNQEIAEKHCPGFEYFLEVSIVKDLVGALDNTVGYQSLSQQINRIIQYAENDA